MFKIPSILNPQVLFETSSSLSGKIKVVQMGNERRLVVGGYVQSINWDCSGVEKRVWGQMAFSALKECPNAKKVLVLGLGAGTVIGLLRKFKPDLYVTAVEIDKEIIEVAKKYFNIFPQKGCVNILNEDALNLSSIKGLGTSDVVLVDVYCGGNFPEKFWSDDFMENLKKSINKDGCAIFNRILRTDVDCEIGTAKAFLLNFFKLVCVRKVNIVGNSGNILFICKN